VKAAGWIAAFFVAGAMAAPVELTPAQRGEDFDVAWRAVDKGYAYFARERAAWNRYRPAARAKAVNARTREDFVAALEGALAILHDDHVRLSEGRLGSRIGIWARWQQGEARVEAVRAFGDADVAGLRPGQRILRIDGAPVDKAVARRLQGHGPVDAAARDWALRHALSDLAARPLRIEVQEGSGVRAVEVERKAAPPANGPAIVARRIGEHRDLGYIRLKSGPAGEKVADHFEGALHHLRDTRGLLVDLRDVPTEGSRAATLAILGLFTAREKPWQLRELRGGKRVVDKVAPSGVAPYGAPVLVLVDRWTAGEGEALAAGLVAVAGARLVGTRMAELRGEPRRIRLPHSGIVVSFPAERTLQLDGKPREILAPHVEVDLSAPSGGPGDPILYRALKEMEKSAG